jgi:multidrug efflux pump subunit AcrB
VLVVAWFKDFTTPIVIMAPIPLTLIDFAELRRRKGMALDQAIIDAGASGSAPCC